MLYLFGFERIGVVLSDLYFVDPNPIEGQEGAERGVRLEVRFLDRGELHGSIYSAQPIEVGRPIWRGDLLESVASTPGTLDRAHHHPRFRGWEPGSRHFVEELSADPVEWVRARLADLPSLLQEAGVSPDEVAPDDAAALRDAVPEIVDTLGRMLERVKAGKLGHPPRDAEAELTSARVGWL